MSSVASRFAGIRGACWSFLRAQRSLVLLFLGTSALVWLGSAFGHDILRRNAETGLHSPGVIPSLSNWDGNFYFQIVNDGYKYDPQRASRVAFFPGYPLLTWLLKKSTGLATRVALPVTSLVALVASLMVFQSYLRVENDEEADAAGQWSQIALCLWPAGLFLRMGYSESLFLVLMLLAMLGLRRNWQEWRVALLIGAATGVRSVGVALLLPLVWNLWIESRSPAYVFRKGIILGPLACWGLFAYITFLDCQFQAPLAFVQTQQFWASRPQPGGLQNLLNLLTLEPIWSVYVPGTSAYWKRYAQNSIPLFCFPFFNPIYFVMCAGLVVYGFWKRWLTVSELLLSAGLLGIPYVMQAHRMVMLGHGRFTCVVFPMFIVLGRLLSRAPTCVQVLIATLMGIQLFYWTAMFSAWHRVY